MQLRCEYSTNPIGIDEPIPRFSWIMDDPRPGAVQQAYQIQAASTERALLEGRADLWDTLRVSSGQSLFIPWGGHALSSRQRVWWQVRIWDLAGEPTDFSQPAFFEMGLLQPTDWQAQWIETGIVGGARTCPTVPMLRKQFSLGSGIVKARLYVSALGLYECRINGQRVGDKVFRPGWTDYHRRVQYDTYDVTELLDSGPNVLGALLGDGWYCGHVGNRNRQTYGDRPRLLAQLEIELKDGTRQTILSDSTWRYHPSPILESDLLMGEAYDARLMQKGWDLPGFDDSSWNHVRPASIAPVKLVAPPNPPVRCVKELSPIAEPRKIGPGSYIFDLGQNMVGWARIQGLKGRSGSTIRLRFAEMLQPNGMIYTENLRGARCTDYYTFSGQEHGESWEPRFTYHGFRYVELTGVPAEMKVSADTIRGIVVHSDTEPTGSFECSDPLLNQLHSNITWGQRGNFLEVPTDCPQRDERLGWTGDAQIFIRTACFNMDVSGFFVKWQQDIADAQSEDGAIPYVVPDPRPHFGLPHGDAGPAWSDAAVICPWTIYRCYGDKRILERYYDSLVKYVAHLESISHDLIRSHFLKDPWGGFGDWVAMDVLIGSDFTPCPKDLIGTAYFARVTGHMADIARVLGKTEDARKYDALRSRIVQAFNREFVTPAGRVQGHNQTAFLLALAFDMLPEDKRPTALEHLLQHFEKRKWHLSTGFVGTPLICPTLSRFGKVEEAYRVLLQRDFPSWLYSVLQGATTIWERWNSYSHEHGFGPVGMNSFNHYAYGAVGEWMYATIGGIDLDPDPLLPAYARSIIRPQPGGGITAAKASLRTPYGLLSTDWRIADGHFILDAVVPANTQATVILPVRERTSILWTCGDTKREVVATPQGMVVSAGRHRFQAAMTMR